MKNSAHFLRYLMLYSYLSKKPWHMFHTVWLLMRSSPAHHVCTAKMPAMLKVASNCKTRKQIVSWNAPILGSLTETLPKQIEGPAISGHWESAFHHMNRRP